MKKPARHASHVGHSYISPMARRFQFSLRSILIFVAASAFAAAIASICFDAVWAALSRM
jgi:hypothetical protein